MMDFGLEASPVYIPTPHMGPYTVYKFMRSYLLHLISNNFKFERCVINITCKEVLFKIPKVILTKYIYIAVLKPINPSLRSWASGQRHGSLNCIQGYSVFS